MLWKTHIWGGIQAGIILAAVTNAEPKTALVEIGAATIGSILPDIDQQNSKISRSDIALSLTSKGLSKVNWRVARNMVLTGSHCLGFLYV